MNLVFVDVLTQDTIFNTLVPRIYQRGAVEDEPQLPFAVYAMLESPRLGRSYRPTPRMELWVYQARGDYSVVDAALARADDLMLGITHRSVGTQRIAEATPEGWSGYLYDDQYEANARTASYRLVGTTG